MQSTSLEYNIEHGSSFYMNIFFLKSMIIGEKIHTYKDQQGN